MNKLNFDRLINMSIAKGETITIPKGEFWKGRAYGVSSYAVLSINGESVKEPIPIINCTEGAVMKTRESSATIQCIAFKVVENV